MPWEPTKLERERLEKLQRIKDRGIDPYPGLVSRTHTNEQAVAAFEAAEPQGESASAIPVTVCGRMRAMRDTGKLSFVDLEDGTGRVQLFIRLNDIGEAMYDVLKKDLDLGDFVEASG